MNNQFLNKRTISFKNLIHSFIFLFSVVSFSYLLILSYSFLKTKDQLKKDPGFAKATPVEIIDLCNRFSKLEKCANSLVNDFKKNKRNILFLGNSQTGAINDFMEGDETYFSIINNNFYLDKDLEIKGIWLPNANFREFETLYNELIECKLEIKILFVPAFLDDTRSDQIRNSLIKDRLCSNEISKKIIDKKGNVKKLNAKIIDNLSLLNTLKNINQEFKVDLYRIRNFIFNIKPQSIRRIKNSSYKNNLISLQNIINQRSELKLKTIIYIPPLLNADGNGLIPYSYKEYKKFKFDLKNICQTNTSCSYYNLENLVPNGLWGKKDSTTFGRASKELDFMHFTYEGHKLLAKKLSEILSNFNKF